MALDLPCANRVYRFKCEDPHNEYVAVRSGLTKERGWSRVAKAKAAEGEAASRGGGSATQPKLPQLICLCQPLHRDWLSERRKDISASFHTVAE